MVILLLQIKAHDQPNRIEIYQKTMEVLEPEMAKIRQLLHYQVSCPLLQVAYDYLGYF